MEDVPIPNLWKTFDSTDYFEYLETIFVYGDLSRYIRDLEWYFRTDMMNMESGGVVRRRENDIRHINESIERYNERKRDPSRAEIADLMFHPDISSLPFDVDSTNYKDALEWLQAGLEAEKALMKSQRINHGRVLSIIYDGADNSSLDLTNYSYTNYIVRIKYTLQDDGRDAIRMRVFFRKGSMPISDITFTSKAEGFAYHANLLKGVEAVVIKEDDVEEDIPSLEDFSASGKIRRSRPIVKPPAFDIQRDGDKAVYTIHLGDAEMRMLKKFITEENGNQTPLMNYPAHLHYGSSRWSPYQARQILRNMLGILDVRVRGEMRRWYEYYYLSELNLNAAYEALNNGGDFTKAVDSESLSTLAAMFSRTSDLRERYGSNFYPRFVARGISDISGLSPEETQKSFDDLAGILATSKKIYWQEGYFKRTMVPERFLSKTGMRIAADILRSEGLIE